jgi:3-hydroxyacyl-CoA dehydrogenase
MFSAGADIRQFGKEPPPAPLPEVIDAVERSAKPVVAAIHGVAAGGALARPRVTRALTADARVGLPEVTPDHPGGGRHQRLPRLIGIRSPRLITEEVVPARRPTPRQPWTIASET